MQFPPPLGEEGARAAAPLRKILHVDMDAFFAAVEQRDNPELRGKPTIVGGSPWGRGVVSTCSYEARSFGVRSAMASRRALELCPNGIFLAGRMDYYAAVSRDIFSILLEFTDLVEPLSIDEAFLDVTDNRLGERSATRIGRHIQREIRQRLQLSCSVGVSYNCFLAKMASGRQKPAGLTVIAPEGAAAFLSSLPVSEFYGIGRATAKKLRMRQIFTGNDLLSLSLGELEEMLGKVGRRYYGIVHGHDPRPVNPVRLRKSLSRERTFAEDLRNLSDAVDAVRGLAEEVSAALRRENFRGRTVTLKLRYDNFESISRSCTLPSLAVDGHAIAAVGEKLLRERTAARPRPIRLLGIAISTPPARFPDCVLAPSHFQPELPLLFAEVPASYFS
jgi:DNA polymerase-4